MRVGDDKWWDNHRPTELRSPYEWKHGHPHSLTGTYPKDEWWDFLLTWCRIGGQVRQLHQDWDRFVWGWQRLGSACQSRVDAERCRAQTEFVRLRLWHGYGIVLARQKRKGQGDLCTIRVVKDRHYNWLPKPRVVTLDEHWLTPVKPWPMDLRAPYNTGMPEDERWARRKIACGKKAERARKQILRRQWRGLE